MQTSRCRSLAAAALSCLAAGCMQVSVALAPTPVTVATGTPGGLYHPVGNAICRLFNLASEHQAIPCVAVSSDGAVANIRRVQGGETTFGLSQTDVAYAAFHGEGMFSADGADPSIRMLIALYPDVFTVLARADSGIRDFADLRDRRVGIGKIGAGFTFTRDVILGYYGWLIGNPDALPELGPADQNQALCGNKVDAMIFAAGHPNGLTQEVTTGCPTRLVRVAGPEIDELLATHSYYRAATIPGGMYAGNPDDILTIGSQAVLVTSDRVSDDLAYSVVKAVFENFADFQRMHPALSKLSVRDMVPSEEVVPIHPGAMKYFREVGLVP